MATPDARLHLCAVTLSGVEARGPGDAAERARPAPAPGYRPETLEVLFGARSSTAHTIRYEQELISHGHRQHARLRVVAGS
ncbi:MAG TPA: hypothetical protein VF328_04575 [Mycobacterium sp.]